MKRSMDDAISEYQHIKSEYAGMKEENDRLNSELIEAKHIADLSASQASALLSMNAKDKNIDNPLVGQSNPALLASSSVELESRLARAQNQVLMLQNTCKTLVSLVQKITRSNWYRHAPINQGLLELSDGLKAENEINLSAASKIKVLIETLDSLESKLRENEAEIETLKHEKDLLETRLSRALNRNCEPNDLLNQLTETKSKLFVAQRELRHSSHQVQLLEAKNNILERSNSHLETNAANAELLFVANGQHPYLDIISSLVSFQSGECNEEKDKAEDVLKQVASNLSHYVAEMKNMYSAVLSLRAHRVESIQISCLNDLVKEKDRMIISLKQNLTQAKQDLQNVNGAPRHRNTDDSTSSFRTIGSIANLAKCSPKRSFYEEAITLVSRKDNELKDCSRQISELKVDNLRLSSRLEDATKQSELYEADISTLVSRLNGEESTIAELEKELSIQKQMHRDSIASLEQMTAENEKLKNQMINHAKKRKEIEARVNKLDNDLARTKRILSVARQGKARSEAMVKEISAKEETAREEVAKLQKELGDVKTKLLAATEDKVAASRQSRAATTKLKALTERFDPDAHEKIKDSLEQRVAVLNQTVSGLASQNSKLRSQLGILKKEQEESLETIKRQHASKEQSSSRVRTCNQCKSHESRISSLEKLLASEKKISADNKQMLQMYQLRSSNADQAPGKQNQEESKCPSPRPSSASVSLILFQVPYSIMKRLVSYIFTASFSVEGSARRNEEADESHFQRKRRSAGQVETNDSCPR
jgi:chromosome segregation ATPase